MIRTGRKGGIFVSMIILLVIYLFAVAIVLVFFYFFKFHITTTVLDEYRWNKIQEVPLDLFSIDVDGEQFVSKMNKIYHKFEPEDQLDKVKKMVNSQLYFAFGDVPPNIGYILTIGEVTVSQSDYPDCGCKPAVEYFSVTYKCQGGCALDLEGEDCVGGYTYNQMGTPQAYPDPKKCFYVGLVEYHGDYPFPLTFNGTDKFIAGLSYDAVVYE